MCAIGGQCRTQTRAALLGSLRGFGPEQGTPVPSPVRNPGGGAPLLSDERMQAMASTTPARRLISDARQAHARMSFDGVTMDLSGGLIGGFDPAEFAIVDPTVGGTSGAVIIHLGAARWALPRGVRIAPGHSCIFVMTATGRAHALLERGGRVRELQGPVAFEARVRREYFGASS